MIIQIKIYEEKEGVLTSVADSTKKATCTITVVAVTSVAVSPSTLTLGINDTYQLTATVNPSNMPDKRVTWASSNTTFATVSSTGLVTVKAA